jgi:hypothetical protein
MLSSGGGGGAPCAKIGGGHKPNDLWSQLQPSQNSKREKVEVKLSCYFYFTGQVSKE